MILLGIKKALDTIKKIGSREKRITNYIIHNISRQIVNRALEANALIVLGDIKHLRRRKQSKNMGRKFNRKLAGFQYYRLTQYIKYKAALAGIKVIQVSEARYFKSGLHNIVESVIRKVQERFKACLNAKIVTYQRMQIETLPLTSPTGL